MPLCACLGGKEKAQAVKVETATKKSTQNAAGGDKGTKSSSLKVYVTRNIHEEALAILKEHFDVEVWQSENKVPRDKLLQEVQGASVIICTVADEIDEEVLSAAGPSLKAIGSMTSGVSHIDQEECRKRGILLHHVADLCADANAEVTVALLLVTAKRLIEGHDAVLDGEWKEWKPMWICGYEIKNKTLGFLGFGRVGFRVAKRLEGFGLKRMIYYASGEQLQAMDVHVERVDTVEEIFTESDFILCCLTLSEETKDFINKENMSLCKPECVIVNTARAEIVNQDDLVACLEDGVIAGAGLDVTTPEPLPPSHPLLQQPHCVITPHMGTATTSTRRRMAIHLAKAVVDELAPSK